ncbi:Receptor-like serine/threonine-protein kinase SD1-8 [Citrus sinensis]|nr:Receptor-like serine/threonine-protein kinase SD1-8 [Citrus sinensis]
MENRPCFNIFRSLIFLLGIKVSLAADTLTPASFIRDGEKLVSSSQRFELGFFSPGKSKNRYVGLWYQKIPDTVLWVANRNSPISDHNAVLTIGNNGNLVLLNQTNGTIWSTNVSRQVKNPVARLLDNGNLVITDNSSSHTTESYLWQSFDYLTDTLLPDMKLGWDLKTGLKRYLSSWESADDPSPGKFTFGLDIQVSPKLCTFNGSAKYSCTGQWNGAAFVAVPNSNFLYDKVFVENKDEISVRYESFNSPNIMILKVNASGLLTSLIWNERSTAWDTYFSVPDEFCLNYGHCGPNNICSLDQTPICQCLKGFKLKSQDNQTWPIKCERSSDCKSGDQFIKLDDFKAPDLLEVSLNDSMNLNQCQAECLKNCSCRAYANSKLTGGGSGCLMWFGDLIDLRKPISNLTGQSVYIRVPAPDQGNKKLLWIIVILVLPLVLLPSFYIFRRRRRKHKEKENMETNQDLLAFDINMSITTRTNELCEADGEGNDKSKDSWLPLFSLASVSAATENFSTQCKLGEGGFGPVYKVELLLPQIHLVRLFGCCIEQGENILIYEYMPNKSLDVFLFDPKKKRLLGWQARVRIIEGIAQGLLYLHQYSRLRIIHRDLKASNILLDSDMNPKISDFGMAGIFGGDELEGNTKRIVGTYGYMSPEYALEGLYSIKSDVFSFGVLMLETLSSKKNTGVYNSDSSNLLGYAWGFWKDDRAHELMDPVIKQDEVSLPMLIRYINVALLCVQENAADRPIMSDVISMIESEHLNLPSPKEPAFTNSKNMNNSSHSSSGTSQFHSVNDVTVSLIYPR